MQQRLTSATLPLKVFYVLNTSVLLETSQGGRWKGRRTDNTYQPMTDKNQTGAAVAEPQTKPKPQHIDVAVITTSGSWPKEGFDNVPVHQPIKIELHQAA